MKLSVCPPCVWSSAGLTIHIQILSNAKIVRGLLRLPFWTSTPQCNVGLTLLPKRLLSPKFLKQTWCKIQHIVWEELKIINEWKSQQSFSKEDNLSLISYLLNENIREQQLYVSLISFWEQGVCFYPLGSLTAKTNPQQQNANLIKFSQFYLVDSAEVALVQ